jgi:TolB protein
MRLRLLLASTGVAAALAIGGCGGLLLPTVIIFETYRNGDADIYAMKFNGSSQTPITNDAFTDRYPAMSPNGERIAFVSDRGGGGVLQLWTMDADGTNRTRISFSGLNEYQPAWSPSGNKIVFTRTVGPSPGNARDSGPGRSTGAGAAGVESFNVYECDSDGTDLQQITQNGGDSSSPYFSPDGNFIYFGSNRDGDFEIYRCNANALESGVVQLTNNGVFDYLPRVAPDNSRIAYMRGSAYQTSEIFTMTPLGASQTALTASGNTSAEPWWTSDSEAVVYSSDRAGAYEIWRIQSDGSGDINLTTSADDDVQPSAQRSDLEL